MELLNSLPNKFNIVRESDSFYLVWISNTTTKIDRTRFRHSGSRKWRDELVIVRDYSEMEVTKEQAESIVNSFGKKETVHNKRYDENGKLTHWVMFAEK